MSLKREITTHQRQLDIIHVVQWVRESIMKGDMEKCDASIKAAEILKLSRSTITKYCNKNVTEVCTPQKTATRKGRSGVKDIDEFTKSSIRNLIYQMHAGGKPVTLASTLKEIKERGIDFKGSISSLHRLLPSLGFIWKKCDGRKMLLEQPQIVVLRINFLRTFQLLKQSSYSYFVYLDETWIFSKGVPVKTWQDDHSKFVMKRKNLDQGTRYIILHAGSKEGFVEDVGLIFSSGKKTGDYHGDMNAATFEGWLQDKLIPSLPEPAVIVFDNASYHSAQIEKNPNTKTRKDDLKKWLDEHHVSYSPTALWQELYALAMQNKCSPKYRADEMIRAAGHAVLPLPPYHCQYNPIEMIWSQCKGYYNKNAARLTVANEESVIGLWREALQQVTPEMWKNSIHHCEKLILKDWETEMNVDAREVLQPIIVRTGSLESDSESDNENSDIDGDLECLPLKWTSEKNT